MDSGKGWLMYLSQGLLGVSQCRLLGCQSATCWDELDWVGEGRCWADFASLMPELFLKPATMFVAPLSR